MLLKVSEKASFWGFGDLWLTAYEDNGVNTSFASLRTEPYEVDFDNLDVKTQDAIRSGLSRGVLICIKEKEENPVVVENFEYIREDSKQLLKDKAKKLLTKNTNTIRREIAKTNDVTYLEVLMESEKKEKNRKTVLNLLQTQYSKLAVAIPTDRFYDNMLLDIEDDEVITISMGADAPTLE